VRQYHAQGEFLPGAAAPLNKVFYTKDHLGSVRELVNGNGTLQTRYDYDLWGGRTKITGTVESEVGYTGHHHHGKSGLVLTWYRAYDPVTGRWLSPDPIGEAGGINLYGYVGNNPINWVDPDGRIALPAVAGVAALVVAGGIHAYQIANAASQMAPGESAYLQTPLTVAMNVASGVGDAAAITFGPNGSEGMWVVHIWVDSCGQTHHEWVIIPQFTGA
jgi:RHS repeat-associated protein